MCAGNYKNQEIAIKGQVIISINSILEKESFISQVNFYCLLIYLICKIGKNKFLKFFSFKAIYFGVVKCNA